MATIACGEIEACPRITCWDTQLKTPLGKGFRMLVAGLMPCTPHLNLLREVGLICVWPLVVHSYWHCKLIGSSLGPT